MLTCELAYHRQEPGAPPDGVILHRKYRGPEPDDVLMYDVRCAVGPGGSSSSGRRGVNSSGVAQAVRLHQAIMATRTRWVKH